MIKSATLEASLDNSLVRDPSLSLFQKVLLTTDGTVTQLLELYTGLPLRAHKLEQTILRNVHPQWLLTAGDDRVLKRTILLCNDQQNALYAESFFALDRLPVTMQRQLLENDRPIGLLWRAQRMETYREIVAYHREPAGLLASHFGLGADEELLSRTYLIYHRHQPIGVITEKFPVSYYRN
ncbi:MAG: chorismate pyruvate-lyase family protein [Steroidobacteraceae bacterium]